MDYEFLHRLDKNSMFPLWILLTSPYKDNTISHHNAYILPRLCIVTAFHLTNKVKYDKNAITRLGTRPCIRQI